MLLPPRATLLLYTDGLVERRRQSLDHGIGRATDLLQDGKYASALDDLASEMTSRLVPDGGYQDDVALLLYRQPAPLEMDFPADASHLAATRTALRVGSIELESIPTRSRTFSSRRAKPWPTPSSTAIDTVPVERSRCPRRHSSTG